MKKLMALAFLLLTTANAAPLLGTKDSFVNAPFCKKYQCSLLGKDELGANISDWRYMVKHNDGAAVISILRQNDVVISAGIEGGGQDSTFMPGMGITRMTGDLIGLMSGKVATEGNLLDIENGCSDTPTKVKTVAWNTRYRVSCLLSHEYSAAWRLSLHVRVP